MPNYIGVPSALTPDVPETPTYIFNGNVTMIGCNNTASGCIAIQVEHQSEARIIENSVPKNDSNKWRRAKSFLARIAPLIGPGLLYGIKFVLRWLGFDL